MAKPLGVDAVAETGGQMPFGRHAERGEFLRRLEKRLRWDEFVAVAVDQQHRRTRSDLSSDGFRVIVRRKHQQPGIADDRRRRDRSAQADMQRHHGSLAKANERQRRGRQAVTGKFRVDKTVQHWRRLVDPDPTFVWIAEGERKPLPADRRLSARLGRMRRYERRVRQGWLPNFADLDEIVAVGAVAMKENDKLSRGPGARR